MLVVKVDPLLNPLAKCSIVFSTLGACTERVMVLGLCLMHIFSDVVSLHLEMKVLRALA